MHSVLKSLVVNGGFEQGQNDLTGPGNPQSVSVIKRERYAAACTCAHKIQSLQHPLQVLSSADDGKLDQWGLFVSQTLLLHLDVDCMRARTHTERTHA
eukprot:scaffold199032_cov23-Tisochrysis_lutea.AAC.1